MSFQNKQIIWQTKCFYLHWAKVSKYSRGWYYLDIGVFMEACKKTKLSNNFSHANMWSIVKVEEEKTSIQYEIPKQEGLWVRKRNKLWMILYFWDHFFWKCCWDLSYFCETSVLLRNLMSKHKTKTKWDDMDDGAAQVFCSGRRIMECAEECSDVWSPDIIPPAWFTLHIVQYTSQCCMFHFTQMSVQYTVCTLHNERRTSNCTDPLTSSTLHGWLCTLCTLHSGACFNPNPRIRLSVRVTKRHYPRLTNYPKGNTLSNHRPVGHTVWAPERRSKEARRASS